MSSLLLENISISTHPEICPGAPAWSLSHPWGPGSCGIPCVSAEGTVVGRGFWCPHHSCLWVGSGSVGYLVGWWERKGSKGPARSGAENWAVGSCVVAAGQSWIPGM